MKDQPKLMDKPQTVEFYENRCCICLVPFPQVKRGRLRQTCSAACRQQLYRLRHPERIKAQKKMQRKKRRQKASRGEKAPNTCLICGKALAQPRTGRRRKTCSDACRKRLWRQSHPTCAVCGQHFKPARCHSHQKYCSERCQWRAKRRRQRQRAIEKQVAAYNYRSCWGPRKGSGYREELIPWEGEAVEGKIVRERRPEPNYPALGGYDGDEAFEPGAWDEAAPGTRDEAAQRAEAREAARRASEARRVAWELLEDESRWWEI